MVVSCSSSDSDADPTLAPTAESDPADTQPVETDPPSTEAPSTVTPTTESAPIDPAIEAVAGLPGADGAAIDDNGTNPLATLPDDVALPIVFVHGFAGSAQQYESQAMRFVANGYPAERIFAYDHDGAGFDIEGYANGVAALIDQVLAETGFEQVYLVGHSRGTSVSGALLTDPSRAAKVAKYIAVDGAPCPVDVVACLAPTQELIAGQAHVEVATSKESFAMQYEFLVGDAPAVVDVVPQRAPVVISGRAVNFPENTGRAGTTLDVWRIDESTGARQGETPHASFPIGDDGEFGPLVLESGAHYEYSLTSPDSPNEHHLYLQPYVRSSHFVRLLSSPPDGATRTNTNIGDGHSSLVVLRMREWYAIDDADVDGDERDVLEISTDGGPTANAIVEFVGNGAIGLHIHDDAATPGESSLSPLPYFSEQPFQSGIDVSMPASVGGTGVITITNFPRGDDDPQTFNVPNWPSSTHAISIVFTDYPLG